MVFLEDLATPSWHCVRFLDAAAEWPPAEALAERGLALLDLSAGGLTREEELLDGLAKTFQFPSYWGRNWDAVDECLRDLEWLPARGCVLRVWEAAALWQRLPFAAGALVESWLLGAEEWAREGVAFHLFFLGTRPADG
jgi:Barstar (barnase inhibitor)